MKRGDIVAVCHDGKWGRRVKGEVIETRRGHHIKIKFDGVEFWARKFNHIHHRKVRKTEWGTSITCERYGKYGGWAETDEFFMPWFAIYKWKDE